jgi:hypothetical protein
VYQNIYFTLRPYFIKNKYVPPSNTIITLPLTIGLRAPPPRGCAPQFENLWPSLLFGIPEVRKVGYMGHRRVDRKIILKCIFSGMCVNRLQMSQSMVKWRASMNRLVPQSEFFLSRERMPDSWEAFCSKKLVNWCFEEYELDSLRIWPTACFWCWVDLSWSKWSLITITIFLIAERLQLM